MFKSKPFILITKNGTIKTKIGNDNDNIGDVMLYKLNNCRNCALLFINFAKSQSINKYFSQNPVSDFISFHAVTVSSIA